VITRLLLPLLAFLALGAQSSRLDFGLRGGEGVPITVDADEGIEWMEREQLYRARGNARATRGEVTVFADELVAHYRKKTGGGTEIWRLVADGSVRLVGAKDEEARGDHAVYEIDKAVLLLTGKNLRLTAGNDIVTARDSLEYWSERRLLVARGEAVAIRLDRRLKADTIAGRIQEQPNGQSRIDRVEATGAVHISTPREIARSARAVWNADTEIATLQGKVRITRGDNQLDGEYAEMNMKTGVSRLLAAPAGTPAPPGNRVRGLIKPEERKPETEQKPR
jgi:lipopolysaccharide export system protein LptA